METDFRQYMSMTVVTVKDEYQTLTKAICGSIVKTIDRLTESAN